MYTLYLYNIYISTYNYGSKHFTQFISTVQDTNLKTFQYYNNLSLFTLIFIYLPLRLTYVFNASILSLLFS